ncbi:unnamed protein product [Diabrotica balteata]|uniref:Uncharacterized protein n=1 Tax=Diabrotica balteata TaxID=107213 RepID=A0A9N9TFY5_DIABA|nr:unnamed protein product [Diabrotica balteata]
MPAQQEQTSLHPWQNVPKMWKPRCILVHIDPSASRLNPPLKMVRHHYFGSQTKMRARRAPLQDLEVGSMVSTLKQLVEIKLWLHESPTILPLNNTMIAENNDRAQQLSSSF